MTVGKNIHSFRKKAGLSQTELARRVGLAASTISELESGKSISSTRIVDIARALGVKAEDLLAGTTTEDLVDCTTNVKPSQTPLSDNELDLIYSYRKLKSSDKAVLLRVIEGLKRGR